MFKGRRISKEEKLAIVKRCLSGEFGVCEAGRQIGVNQQSVRERYYGRRFTSREELVQMIEDYITYYNYSRVQRNLGVLTPMEKHESYLMAA